MGGQAEKDGANKLQGLASYWESETEGLFLKQEFSKNKGFQSISLLMLLRFRGRQSISVNVPNKIIADNCLLPSIHENGDGVAHCGVAPPQ